MDGINSNNRLIRLIISLENASELIKNGAIAIGTGSNLTAGAKTGEFEYDEGDNA